MEEGYPRNRVIIEGLRKNGVDVVECHEDFWKDTDQKLEGVKAGSGIIKTLYRLLLAYSMLICKFRRVGYYDVLIVGYAGHIDIFLAKALNLLRRKPLILDEFLSLYDTAVMDRRIVLPGSVKAKLLRFIDTWSCWIADAVLLDTQAHVDYFVKEFRLPAEKFHAIPVGSYLSPPESCRIPLSQETSNPSDPQIPHNPPLIKGERRDFNVLYFGSYIPLHGVDVILEAAKLLQDENPPPLSPLPQGEGRYEGVPLVPPPLTGGGEACPELVEGGEGERRAFSDESEVVFTLIGTGQLLSAMKELALSLELNNVIFIDRFVREEELIGYIMESDICLGVFGQTDKAARVIPCKVYNCLALGKPLITMSSPAMDGVLTRRENVFFCRPGDPDALSEAILTLRNDGILREKIACSGQDYFEKNFSAKAIGKTVLSLIESL